MATEVKQTQVEVHDPSGSSDLDGRYMVLEEREDGTLVLPPGVSLRRGVRRLRPLPPGALGL